MVSILPRVLARSGDFIFHISDSKGAADESVEGRESRVDGQDGELSVERPASRAEPSVDRGGAINNARGRACSPGRRMAPRVGTRPTLWAVVRRRGSED